MASWELIEPRAGGGDCAAAQEVIDGKWDAEFVVDVFQAGAGVSFHMNANEVIANRANEILGGALGKYEWVHPNDHVNYGQSTNDVFPTAMRLGTLLALEGLYPVLDGLAEEFCGEGRGVRWGGEGGADAYAGCDADPAGAGVCGVRGGDPEGGRESCGGRREGLRELGLGGSAVGTGINTHPEYRELAIAKLAADLRAAAGAGGGHAVGDAVVRADGGGEWGAAGAGAGGDPDCE